jgi:hypothetical protein
MLGATLVRDIRQALSPGGALYLLGRGLEAAGLLRGGRWAYAASLARAERSTSRAVFKVLQWRQYHLERLHHLLGHPRVSDPLFSCAVAPAPASPRQDSAAGSFRANWAYSGLCVDVITRGRGSAPLRILLNGHELRNFVPHNLPVLPGFFSIIFKRPVVGTFPVRCTLEVRTEDGVALASGGATRVDLSVPHGTGTIGSLLTKGITVDKKGCFAVTASGIEDARARLLEIYAAARDAFDAVLGKRLFLLYGTLLGHVRDGDYIPGDDDFDVGYFSTATSAAAVKEEAKDMVVRLVRAGFVVSFNRLGRLFRIRRPGDSPEMHLDVSPVWQEDGMILAHPKACIRCVADDFVPAVGREFRGLPVYLPRRPERFLQEYYGPDWRVPDPAYSADRISVPTAALRSLDRTCVDGSDLRDMLARIGVAGGNGRGSGRLISIGTHDLYPLEEYERYCEWSV